MGMAYKGTTELSSDANPPRALFSGMWGARSTNVLPSSVGGQNLWLYNTTDGSSSLVGTTFFIDGLVLGMKEGDIIMGAGTTGSSVNVYVGVIGPVTTDGCGVASTGGMLGSSLS